MVCVCVWNGRSMSVFGLLCIRLQVEALIIASQFAYERCA